MTEVVQHHGHNHRDVGQEDSEGHVREATGQQGQVYSRD